MSFYVVASRSDEYCKYVTTLLQFCDKWLNVLPVLGFKVG